MMYNGRSWRGGRETGRWAENGEAKAGKRDTPGGGGKKARFSLLLFVCC